MPTKYGDKQQQQQQRRRRRNRPIWTARGEDGSCHRIEAMMTITTTGIWEKRLGSSGVNMPMQSKRCTNGKCLTGKQIPGRDDTATFLTTFDRYRSSNHGAHMPLRRRRRPRPRPRRPRRHRRRRGHEPSDATTTTTTDIPISGRSTARRPILAKIAY